LTERAGYLFLARTVVAAGMAVTAVTATALAPIRAAAAPEP
jgi:hypothetical protein